MMQDPTWVKLFKNCVCLESKRPQLRRDDECGHSGIGPDEIMFLNYLRVKYPRTWRTHHMRRGYVTFIEFPDPPIHAKKRKRITPAVRAGVCDQNCMFLRKVPPRAKFIKAGLPVTCKK